MGIESDQEDDRAPFFLVSFQKNGCADQSPIQSENSSPSGDLLEIEAKIIKVGNTSRKIEFNAWKILQTIDMGPYPSSAVEFRTPVLVGKAVGTIVVKKEKQWLHNQEMREKFMR